MFVILYLDGAKTECFRWAFVYYIPACGFVRSICSSIIHPQSDLQALKGKVNHQLMTSSSSTFTYRLPPVFKCF